MMLATLVKSGREIVLRFVVAFVVAIYHIKRKGY